MFESTTNTNLLNDEINHQEAIIECDGNKSEEGSATNANTVTVNRTLTFFFTAKGKDYFKIWITNLALTIITLGIYYPWAKARQQRYFWSHTVVDGYALGFHGRAQSMFKGYAIAAFLSALYYGLSKISPEYGAGMLIFLALIYPILFRASLRFLLLNTSWRGLRFKFKASVKQSYQYLASSIVISCFITSIPLILVFVYGGSVDELDNINLTTYTTVFTFTLLFIVIGVSTAYFYIKKFQRDFYSFANIQTRLNTNFWGFFKVLLKTVGVSVLVSVILAVIGVFVGLVFGVFSAFSSNLFTNPKFLSLLIFTLPLFLFLGYFLYFIVINSYFNSRHFNFFWGNIVSNDLKMESDLKLKPLIILNSKNWILILLSLGLYYPFAKVASTRMQLESLSIFTTLDFNQLVSDASIEEENNLGQAMSDLFDFDFGF